jgi:hypothetical protein
VRATATADGTCSQRSIIRGRRVGLRSQEPSAGRW